MRTKPRILEYNLMKEVVVIIIAIIKQTSWRIWLGVLGFAILYFRLVHYVF